MKLSNNKDSTKKASFVLKKKEEALTARGLNTSKYKNSGLSSHTLKKTGSKDTNGKQTMLI